MTVFIRLFDGGLLYFFWVEFTQVCHVERTVRKRFEGKQVRVKLNDLLLSRRVPLLLSAFNLDVLLLFASRLNQAVKGGIENIDDMMVLVSQTCANGQDIILRRV